MKNKRPSQTPASTPARKRRRWLSAWWLLLVPVIIVGLYLYKSGDTRRIVQTIQHSTGLGADNEDECRKEKNGLVFYFPQYDTVDLMCGSRPDPTDASITLCTGAAFTGKKLKDFEHRNIAGHHVAGGTYYKGYPCKDNTGCFAYYRNSGRWTFAMNDYHKYIRKAEREGGMAFGQNMLVYEGKIQKQLVQKRNSENSYRALAEADGKLCLVEAAHPMAFRDFLDALVRSGVRHALYLDTGRGWNYSFYRDSKNALHYMHSESTPYATNWMIFKK